MQLSTGSGEAQSQLDAERGLGPAKRGVDFARAFGEKLAASGLIDKLGVERAMRAAQKTGERFDHVLIKLGLIAESDLSVHLARFLEIPLVVTDDIPLAPVLAEAIDQKFIRLHGVLPLKLADKTITLGVTDPLADEPIRAIEYLTGLTSDVRLIAPSEFEKAVNALYADLFSEGSGDPSESRGGDANENDIQRLRDLASEAPIIRLVNQIVGKAVEAKASDIHIEPGIDGVTVRIRVDGVLRAAQTLAAGMRAAVTSRIKIMAKLDIAERRMPQDGRVRIAVRGVGIDFRISTIPTLHGESIVMRILDRRNVELDFQKLGFDAATIAGLRALMRQPNGIILVTGPTGSGKTTTLYTALKELNSSSVKMLTVEDPIEYQLTGVNQVQVQPSIGLDFPHALRSILRQDPDIVMIGEIRDVETAQIAIQASLTGHLVLSTLHTNSAAASITRLIDMGIEPYLIASTVKGIMAQRLVRKLCKNCACIEAHPSHEGLSTGHRAFEDAESGAGCEACRGTGFAGRATIAELLVVNEAIHDLILESAPDAALEAAARKGGMQTLYESGLAKVRGGETSLDEVMRVTRLEGV